MINDFIQQSVDIVEPIRKSFKRLADYLSSMAYLLGFVLVSEILLTSAQFNSQFQAPQPPRFHASAPPPPNSGIWIPLATKAVAFLVNSNVVQGAVLFEDQPGAPGKLLITGNITGLSPNTQHGFHIHTYGDLRSGCAGAGSHYNPLNVSHAGPTDSIRHFGDLGNVQANAEGKVTLDITDYTLSLNGPSSVLGRTVVIHEKIDDLGLGANADTKTTGNAGSRLACGIIGLASSA